MTISFNLLIIVMVALTLFFSVFTYKNMVLQKIISGLWLICFILIFLWILSFFHIIGHIGSIKVW